MTRQLPTATEVCQRVYSARATLSPETGRTVSGIAVPYNEPVQIWEGFTEIIAHGACTPRLEPVPAFYRHREVIGALTSHTHTKAGWAIDMHVSDTQLGNDALTLARDGGLTRFSIGFRPVEFTDETDDDGNITRTITCAEIHEVSLVPQPAYLSATVDEIRESPRKEPAMPDTTSITRDMFDSSINEVREEVRDELRALALRSTTPTAPPATDPRSAGMILKACLSGDETALRSLEAVQATRTWDGIKAGDGGSTENNATWVKDLTRLVDNANPLARFFSTAPLPDEGSFLEFGQLAENTLTVAEQAKEGDTLTSGKISVKEETTKVRTHGGYTSLSRQTIERAPVNVLDLALRGMAIAAGKHAASTLATEINTAVKARTSSALTVSKAASALKWADWVAMLIDVAKTFREAGLPVPPLFVNSATFTAMAALTDKDDRPLFAMTTPAPTQLGTVELGTAEALEELGLSTLKVVHNAFAKPSEMGAGVAGAFISPDALRRYSTPLVRLQDSNILNLTAEFSVYTYDAYAVEIPDGIVPLKMEA